MSSSQMVAKGWAGGVAVAAPVVAFERGGSYAAGGSAAGSDAGPFAGVDDETLGGTLAALPPLRLARVLGAAVSPLPDEAAGAALRAAAAHVDDRAALAVCAELTATWSSAELLSLGETVITRLGERVLGGAVDDAGLHDAVARLQRLAIRTEAEKLRRVREVAERRSHLGIGARRPADLLTRLGLTNGEARQQADLAQRLADLPKTAQALAQGRIGLGQATEAVKALADAQRAARDRAAAGDGAGAGGNDDGGNGHGHGDGAGGEAGNDPDGAGSEGDDGLDARGRVAAERDAIDDTVAGAGAGTDRRQTREQLDALAARRSRNRLADAERRAHRTRHGRTYRDGDRMTIKLSGPGALTQKIWTMIQALARPHEAGETRTQEQRTYDAAVEIADRYLAEGTLPDVTGLPAQLLLIASHDALHGVDGADPPIVDGFGPVSSDTAKMLCCHAEWHVVVTGGDGQPLRVGRVRYQPNRTQRRAVIARDTHCVGCAAPAARCQIHHITWWRHGGRTDIANLVLLCANCHTHVHHHHWTITRDPDGTYHARPPTNGPPHGQPPGNRPPRNKPAGNGPPADETPTSRPPAEPPTILSLLDPPAGAATTPAPTPATATPATTTITATTTRRRTR